MILRIAMHNVGVFASAKTQRDLKRLVLVYAENASGKTTLAEVLRSLETEDPAIIRQKHKFETQSNQYVTIECDGDPSKITFQNGRWGPERMPVRVFDEVFVDSNVYSGLSVRSEHRRRLHNLALGKRGACLSRRRDELSNNITQYSKTMKKAEDSVSEEQRRGRLMGEFCDIPKMENIEAEMDNAEMDLEAVRNSDTVRNTCPFKRIDLPEFDMPAIRLILKRGLDSLDSEAAASVVDHVESLGENGESWIAEGVKYMSGDAKMCPFCRRDAAGARIMDHYRAYFSKAYTRLKNDVKTMLDSVRSVHSSDARVAFERTVGENRDVGHVWSKYNIQLPDIDTAATTAAWTFALERIEEALEAKLAAPLEHKYLDSNTVESYERHREHVKSINRRICSHNYEIRKKKKMAESTTIESARDRLKRLELVKERYSDAAAAWCNMYVQAKTKKSEAEAEKDKVTQQLEKYRREAFPALASGVNSYLCDFGAGFTIDDFRPTNIGSGSTSNYNVRVGNTPIDAKKQRSDDVPTIGETLSTSDRNTLALAFFLSSLDADEDLSKTTVVIDDPVSSFDDNRSLSTVQALRKLTTRAGQLIILSHKASFLDKIWRKVDRKECLPMSIVHSGAGSSICDWEIGQESNAEQARRKHLLEKYAKSKAGDSREVLDAIRPYLEAVLEVQYADRYNASIQISSFLNECEQKLGKESQILDESTISEMRDILEYANPSKHGSGRNLEEREINRNQLQSYVKKTLSVTAIGSMRSQRDK